MVHCHILWLCYNTTMENNMNFLESFFTISVYNLNLFSFVLGMLWCMMNMNAWGNQKSMWSQILLYTIGVALYYYGVSKGWIQ